MSVIYEEGELKDVTLDKVDVPDEVKEAVERGPGCPQS
jgi:hypothetical protein